LEANEADDSSAAEDIDERHRRSKSPKHEDYGEIEVSVKFDKITNKLFVKVNQARSLINTDKDSLSDPYVRVQVLPDRKNRSKRKTKVIKDSLTPIWDEPFEFEMTQEEAKQKTIDLVVKNSKSIFSREKTFMGECLIDLEHLIELEDGYTSWFQLKDRSFFDQQLKKLQAN
jgi:Ca2+-dependent lipid-binding protein